MPRRQFIADLQQAVQSHGVEGVDDLQAGDDDGQITFLYSHSTLNKPVLVTAGVSELSDYPKTHDYFVFVAEDAPPDISLALQSRLPSTSGKTVKQLLSIVSQSLAKICSHKLNDSQDVRSLQYATSNEEDEPEYDDDDEDEYESDPDQFFAAPTMQAKGSIPVFNLPKPTNDFRQRAKLDLRTAKVAGFKVGHHGDLLDGQPAYIVVSCRISRLGVSAEALQAWQLDPNDYLTLLMYYPRGYKSYEDLQAFSQSTAAAQLRMKVGACTSYKPTPQDMIEIFSGKQDDGDWEKKVVGEAASQGTDEDFSNKPPSEAKFRGRRFREIFMTRPIGALLNERLLLLLKSRASGLSWSGAHSYYNERQGLPGKGRLEVPAEWKTKEKIQGHYPRIVKADHSASFGKVAPSMPLLAMQCLVKHVVRCTEFCLVCFRELSNDLAAIKPYVCDNPLCLYQYTTLGFGPSVEHEIIAQPYVVDLLVSFCYSAALEGKLRSFPTGLGLTVSKSVHARPTASPAPTAASSKAAPPQGQRQTVEVNLAKRLVRFSTTEEHQQKPVRQGQWIVLRMQGPASQDEKTLHCRVDTITDVSLVSIGEPIAIRRGEPHQPGKYAPQVDKAQSHTTDGEQSVKDQWIKATIDVYDQQLDELSDSEKNRSIAVLLATLPNVKDMKDYLHGKRQADLSGWVERLSPSALSVLRWIIASNRACIMQIDRLEGTWDEQIVQQERVYGVPEWLQFRFAMGAPDKEQRFVNAVRQTRERLSLVHPTLFAWHGSPLASWHSIIREGLNFEKTLHGRAFGHGCYHSLEYHTSIGYAAAVRSSHGSMGLPATWPSSLLDIQAAMALNEIVNAPNEFVSRTPHLVVAQLDWIQTRYLLVKSQNIDLRSYTDQKPVRIHRQDPTMLPRGLRGFLEVPETPSRSLSGKRSSKSQYTKSPAKKIKLGTEAQPISVDDSTSANDDDDTCSVATDLDDLVILLDEEMSLSTMEEQAQEGTAAECKVSSRTVPKVTKSYFDPGLLNHSLLPKMPEPSYANTATTKRLQADLRALLKVQKETDPAELGWYIDAEKVDTVYQWIVELHSFQQFAEDGKDIPLVADMQKPKLQSIVLELRFPGSYPMSPPFVRVIQPRFLGFQQGGGGHVTLGGALCMELLTNSGWSAVSSIESVLLQIRLAIASTDPRPARLDFTRTNQAYGVGEAISAYKRACTMHGWAIPPDFQQMAGT